MKNLIEGETYPGLVMAIDGQQLDIDTDGIFVNVSRWDLAEDEINEFRNGDIEYCVRYIGNIIFVMFKIGELRWFHIPYNIHLKKGTNTLSRLTEDNGYNCTLAVNDRTSGKLVVVRAFELSYDVSKFIDECVDKQLSKPFNISHYDTMLNFIYSTMPTEMLVSRCIARGMYVTEDIETERISSIRERVIDRISKGFEGMERFIKYQEHSQLDDKYKPWAVWVADNGYCVYAIPKCFYDTVS